MTALLMLVPTLAAAAPLTPNETAASQGLQRALQLPSELEELSEPRLLALRGTLLAEIGLRQRAAG
ncbi:MAG: hypothetical protein AAF533_30955, partial [Acidobacteriota bacterium]